MIFIDFLKAREEKNKYGMLPLNFNRRTNVAMEHNEWLYVFGFALHILSFKAMQHIGKTDIYNVLPTGTINSVGN